LRRSTSISRRCFLSSRSEASRNIPRTIIVAPAKINSQTYRVSTITASYTNFVLAHSVVVDYPHNGKSRPDLFFCSDVRCLSELLSARMTFRCSFFASPRLFRCYCNSVKCTTRFSTLIYRADCFFQPTKAFFVARTYDLLKNLGEVFEQF